MQNKIFSIFTRTPLHIGAGASVGAIDLPIMRERHTKMPIIPGSSLKGVLKDIFGNDDNQSLIFGEQKKSGSVFFGEGKLLAFPIRSASGAFAWLTCPFVLNRFKNDTGKIDNNQLKAIDVNGMECFAGSKVALNGKALFEEYVFTVKGDTSAVESAISQLTDDWRELFAGRLAVVSDEMFCFFAENACEVVSRIQIDDEKGIVKQGALFSQEQVPSETLFYSVISAVNEDELKKFTDKYDDFKVLQIGGDETIGLGFCSVKLIDC